MSTIEDALAIAEGLKPADRVRLIERLWQSLPKAEWPAANDEEIALLHRRLAEYGVEPGESVPWPIVERLVAERARFSRPKIYSAPRRFDLATVFIVTLAYSVLLGVMSALRLPPVASLIVAGFITAIGVSQALLFGGKRPRLASVLVGTLIYALSLLGFWLATGQRAYPTSTFLVLGTYAAIGGAILGYLSGVVVGGVFLLADAVRRMRRSGTEAEDGPN
jgi:putative addiction module component (TIGR02574 family)